MRRPTARGRSVRNGRPAVSASRCRGVPPGSRWVTSTEWPRLETGKQFGDALEGADHDGFEVGQVAQDWVPSRSGCVVSAASGHGVGQGHEMVAALARSNRLSRSWAAWRPAAEAMTSTASAGTGGGAW